jgi:hypothetical protein
VRPTPQPNISVRSPNPCFMYQVESLLEQIETKFDDMSSQILERSNADFSITRVWHIAHCQYQ